MRLCRFHLPDQGARLGQLVAGEIYDLTGTGILPGDDLTLADGDAVSIEIESIGVLRNAVMQM